MLLALWGGMLRAAVPVQNEKGKWALAQNPDNVNKKDFKYSDIEEVDENTFRVAIGGKIKDGLLEGEKWGVVDASGNWILKADYDDIEPFVYGLAKVTKGDKCGFIDESWRVVIPLKFAFVGTPNAQGFVWVNDGGKPDKKNQGKITGGKYGIYNKEGKEIVPPKYQTIGIFSDKQAKYDKEKVFKKDKPLERLMLECGGHVSLWPRAFDNREDAALGEAVGFAVSTGKTIDKNGVYDLKGNLLVKPGAYAKVAYPTEDLAMVVTKKKAEGFLSVRTGKLVKTPEFKTANPFVDGLAVCQGQDKKWHLYDAMFKEVTPGYNWISPRQGDYYHVLAADGMKLYSISSKGFLPVEGELIFPLTEGYMAFKDKNGKWGYLDASGAVASEPEYEETWSVYNGLAKVKGEKGWGALDASLQKKIEPVWYTIYYPSESCPDRMWVLSDENSASLTGNRDVAFYCMDWPSGEFAFPEGYEMHMGYYKKGNQGYSLVSNDKDNKYFGAVDKNGKVFIPIEMKGWEAADEAVAYYVAKNLKEWKPVHSYRLGIQRSNKCNKQNLKDKIAESDWDY